MVVGSFLIGQRGLWRWLLVEEASSPKKAGSGGEGRRTVCVCPEGGNIAGELQAGRGAQR